MVECSSLFLWAIKHLCLKIAKKNSRMAVFFCFVLIDTGGLESSYQ